MKYIWILTIVGLWACSTPDPTKKDKEESLGKGASTGYDSLLAAACGADAYGMRSYIMANLVAGPNRDQDSATAARLQRAHLDNITRMAEEGKLVLAGPFLDGGDVRGIYVFAVETVEEAEALTATDPAIQAGRLKMELRPWYGSAALMKVGEIHEKLAKKEI
ncbi:YciI family protein [Marinoscillum furvescens]|uniref:Uncharacterized protein YciI n=1 Tax=Marinoscillum furvescens DSM 4134 TaxID=1122208 RepID=A0A3D9L6H0_MARFU|nr:YciI family protein [Marinoscillum furvescens]REE01286.1 uncharacterized protein YciI [Marinoscillum furvescens DSM 4134]